MSELSGPFEKADALGIDRLADAGVFEAIDVHFARTVASLANEERTEVLLAAALSSRQVRAGHVCVPLMEIGGQDLLDENGVVVGACPPAEAWQRVLRESPLVSRGDERRPLVLDDQGRLYLHRYFEHEVVLAEAIRKRLRGPAEAPDARLRDEGLDRMFGVAGPGEVDRQRLAATVAIERSFCVISGGPGTGKTSTVVRLLALLVEQALARGDRAPRVLLLAPTGKAAARLVESIRAAKGRLDASDEVKAAIVEEASTIHRALGVRRDTPTRYRHDASRPLVADVVLVDEASMVDVALMRSLVQAVAPRARLVLLGDRHQLASVEAGSVLAELCDAGAEGASEVRDGLSASIVELTKSYRFDDRSSIGQLAFAVRRGDPRGVLELLDRPNDELSFVEAEPGPDLPSALRELAIARYGSYLRAPDVHTAIARLGEFRILCAHRRGFSGVEHLNRAVERTLSDEGLVKAFGPAYRGRPVLVTQNDYSVGLFNGDVGLLWPDERGDLRAYFVAPDGREHVLSPARLPAHETAFCMSVHKSQGSEHGEVAVVLPSADSPLLTRELVYTGITRAKRRVHVFGSRSAVAVGVERRVVRASGLRDALAR